MKAKLRAGFCLCFAVIGLECGCRTIETRSDLAPESRSAGENLSDNARQFKWSTSSGLDFSVITGTLEEMGRTLAVVGIYGGNHPNPQGGILARKPGKIGPHSVVWLIKDGLENNWRFKRECLINDSTNGTIHVWVLADDRNYLDAAMTELEHQYETNE